MSPATRRLAALAAVFLPSEAEQVLSGLSGSDAAEGMALAAQLACAGRSGRLSALAEAFAPAPCDSHEVIAAQLRQERPRVAAALRTFLPPGLRCAPGLPLELRGQVSPLLARLAAEWASIAV